MSNQNYTQINGKYEPINATACSEIRCMTCNVFFLPQKMQQHLNTHIKPSLQKPPRNSMKMAKININGILEDNPQQTSQIKSFLPQQLPSLQKKRRRAIFLNNTPTQKTNTLMTISELNVKENEAKDIVSQIVDCYIDPEKQNEILSIPKRIKFDSQCGQLKKKGINLYQNSSSKNQKIDEGGVPQKSLPSFQRKSQGYQLKRIIMNQSTSTQNNPQTLTHSYNFNTKKKQPRKFMNISTTSHKKNLQSTLGSTKKHHQLDDFSIVQSGRKFQCSGCKGFYCESCKSAIPPIYRPVPDSQGKYHFHPNKESMEFYKDQYYSKDGCGDCQKKSMIS